MTRLPAQLEQEKKSLCEGGLLTQEIPGGSDQQWRASDGLPASHTHTHRGTWQATAPTAGRPAVSF